MITEKDIDIGFWRFNDGFWPDPIEIEDIEVYETSRLVINTSTLNNKIEHISDYRRKQLIKAWSNTLPKLNNVEFLMVTHQVNQSFFESICKMKNLKGLYIKFSRISSIMSLEELHSLKYLYFGSTPRLTNISGIENLKNLEVLKLENFKNCSDFLKLKGLKKLEILEISGGLHHIKSLDFLKNLVDLKVLTLQAYFNNDDISPLFALKELRKLNIFEDYLKNGNRLKLKQALPKLKYGI